MAHFPIIADAPAGEIASGGRHAALKLGLFQTPVTTTSHAVTACQLADCCFNCVAAVHFLLEGVRLLLGAPGLDQVMVFTHCDRPVFLPSAQALAFQWAILAIFAAEFKTEGGFP